VWEIWTNGLYRATLHRVVHRSQAYRVSCAPALLAHRLLLLTRARRRIPFFYEPAFDARVAPLAGALRLQSAKERARGEKEAVVYGEFLLRKVGANFDLANGAGEEKKGRY
jgi:isopenicillin N synthase-like dioxygenase